MVIERITGGKPQEVRQTERAAAEAKKAEVAKESETAKTGSKSTPVTAEVSERSRAAIKAYRIASQSKPDISRAQRVAQIKAQVEKGEYRAPAVNVAEAVLKNVVKNG